MIDSVVPIEDGAVDLAACRVRRGAQDLALTDIEAALFAYLAQRPGETVERATLLTEVWGYHPAARTRAVDAAMRRLRTKVERAPAEPRHLLAVRGIGYRFAPLLDPRWAHLVGRDALLPRLAAARGLLTLVGPGGVGKTALARALGGGPFVDLSAARSLAECLQAVAAALQTPLVHGSLDPQIRGLGHALAHQAPERIVLDNAEQALPAVRRCVEAWRALAPEVTVLVTSRQVLGLADEQPWPVEPLTAEAAQALLARLTPEGWCADPAIDQLVEAVDRLPLGLELAAGRAPLLTPSQMVQRLDRLGTQGAGRAARQASLEASIAWSWELCDAAEQAALSATALFVGAFDLDAAEVVLPAPRQAVEHLAALRARHLIQSGSGGLRLLESIRRFALARLAPTAEARSRFARWCLRRHAAGVEDPASLQAAFEAVEALDPPLALAVGAACGAITFRRGPEALHHAMVNWCVALAEACTPSAAVGHAWLAQADLLRREARFEAAEAQARRALELAARLEAPALRVAALTAIANVAHRVGRADAEGLFLEAIGVRAAIPPQVRAEALRGHANLLLDQGRLDASEAANAEALHLLRLAGDQRAEAVLQATLGVVALEAGRHAEAHAALTRAVALHRALEDRRFAAVAQSNLAQACHAMGALDAAEAHARESLQHHLRMGNRRFEGFARYILAAIAHERGALEVALEALTAAQRAWQAVEERRFAGYGAARLALLEAARGATAVARHAAEAATRQLEPADAAFARWAVEGGPIPEARSSFGRICRRLIEAPTGPGAPGVGLERG